LEETNLALYPVNLTSLVIFCAIKPYYFECSSETGTNTEGEVLRHHLACRV